MAFTAVTPQAVLPNTSAVVAYTPANAAGDMFANNGKMSFRIKNASGVSITATVQSVPDPYGRSGDLTVVVAAGAEAEVGHLDPALFNQRTGNVGFVQITYSAVTSVTSACLQHG
jgi:hypothetical protein